MSFGPPGAAYGMEYTPESEVMVGRPVSRTQRVSSGVMKRACTLIKASRTLLPNETPSDVFDKPPGGVLYSRDG